MSDRALELAYRYINRRERTVAEVRRHLINRAVQARDADAAIEELTEHGVLDDRRFAGLFVQDKRALEQWGEERIRRGLEAHRIEREIAERALLEASVEARGDGGAEHDELGRALALLRGRFPSPPRARRDRERALGVLLRKGYEYELALDALAHHCEAVAPI